MFCGDQVNILSAYMIKNLPRQRIDEVEILPKKYVPVEVEVIEPYWWIHRRFLKILYEVGVYYEPTGQVIKFYFWVTLPVPYIWYKRLRKVIIAYVLDEFLRSRPEVTTSGYILYIVEDRIFVQNITLMKLSDILPPYESYIGEVSKKLIKQREKLGEIL